MEAVNQKSMTVEKMTSICNPMHDNPIHCLEVAQVRTIRHKSQPNVNQALAVEVVVTEEEFLNENLHNM